ncbi:MAG: alpha-galactosidase [Oscillospiraceae bacterium]|nr:alpha-galactosidase [Oscillospiraceae bacterium]
MIQIKNNVFLLKNENISYMFRVTKDGNLEHLHFGAPVEIDDEDAFAVRYGVGWGSTGGPEGEEFPMYLPMEWSSLGRGDYRESPMELDQEIPAAFKYTSYKEYDHTVAIECGLPQAHGDAETLEIIMTSPSQMSLHLFYTLFDTAVTRRAVFRNETRRSINVEKMMSSMMDIQGDYEITTYNGAWIAEMQPYRAKVGMSGIVNESTTGFSSALHNPGFILSEPDATETDGVVMGFNLIYSGNHYSRVQRSNEGLIRIVQGISPVSFDWLLGPGKQFETPEAVMVWSASGFGGMSENMHRFVNEHIIPQYWHNRERPVLYNDWEGCMFDFTESKLISLAKKAKELGCELFVLDDGWFGERNSDKAGLGDYNVNKKKLPNGLSGLQKKLGDLGLDFGLWFEPEAVNPDSDLFRKHPDWAIQSDDGVTVLGRNELLLDLSLPEVRDYIVENVSRCIDEGKVSYVKWDMNRHSTALGASAHRYILGLYDVLRRIFGPRPEVLLESCSSGGNRFDLGMLCFSPQIWASDNTDAVERCRIQYQLSYLYPLSTIGAHVSAAPHSQTLRDTPLSTRGNISFFGLLGYEFDLADLTPVETDEIKNQIAFYKKYRNLFQFGSFRRLKAAEGISMQVSGDGTAVAGLFHELVHAAPGYERLYPRGLDPKKVYSVLSRRQLLNATKFGGLLRHVLPIRVKPDGAVVRTAGKIYRMNDAVRECDATGAALMSGMSLNARFMGTGYDPGMRMQGDFSSNIYVITTEET